MVGPKTMTATVMAGAQTRTIENQLKAATAKERTMVTARTTMTSTMVTVVAVTVDGGGGDSGQQWQWVVVAKKRQSD